MTVQSDGGEFSRRAMEEAEDLLHRLEAELDASGQSGATMAFRLEGESRLLTRLEAERWLMESVDAGFPRVGYTIERTRESQVIVCLAAFEDPDTQYYP